MCSCVKIENCNVTINVNSNGEYEINPTTVKTTCESENISSVQLKDEGQPISIETFLTNSRDINQRNKIINDIIESFDFEKIHNVMEFLNWTWYDAENGVPCVKELECKLMDMLNTLFKEKCNSVNTGGFFVSYQVYPPIEDEPLDFEHCVAVEVKFCLEDYTNM